MAIVGDRGDPVCGRVQQRPERGHDATAPRADGGSVLRFGGRRDRLR
jgi:hypothetical protein